MEKTVKQQIGINRWAPEHVPCGSLVAVKVFDNQEPIRIMSDGIVQNGVSSYVMVVKNDQNVSNNEIADNTPGYNLCYIKHILKRGNGAVYRRPHDEEYSDLKKRATDTIFSALSYGVRKYRTQYIVSDSSLKFLLIFIADQYLKLGEVYDPEQLESMVRKINILTPCFTVLDFDYKYYKINKKRLKSAVKRSVRHCLMSKKKQQEAEVMAWNDID